MGGAKHGHVGQDRRRKAQSQDVHQQIARRPPGATGMAGYILHLQRTIGNQATGLLLQRERQRQALTGVAALEGQQTAPTGGPPVQRFRTPQGSTNAEAKISDGGGIFQTDKKTVFASASLIEEARATLDGVGSYVTVTGGSTTKGQGLQQVQLQWNPQNVPKASPHNKVSEANKDGTYKCGFADCHRTAQATMGSSSEGTSVETENPVIAPEGGREVIPSVTAKEAGEAGTGVSKTIANQGVYAFFARAFPAFAALLKKDPQARVKHGALIARLEQEEPLSPSRVQRDWAIYSQIVDDPDLQRLFSKTFGVNQFAKPEVGEALSQVNNETERQNAPKEKDLWNFHWAGVIMKDGDDYVTLENLSVGLDRSKMNDQWYFQMYGADQQSFHDEQKKSEHAGKYALTLGFRNTPKVSEAARAEYAAKGKAGEAQAGLTEATKDEAKAGGELVTAKAAAEDPAVAKLAAEEALTKATQGLKMATEKKGQADDDLQKRGGEKAPFLLKQAATSAGRAVEKAREVLELAQKALQDPSGAAQEKHQAAREAAEEARHALKAATELAEKATQAVAAAKSKTAEATKAALPGREVSSLKLPLPSEEEQRQHQFTEEDIRKRAEAIYKRKPQGKSGQTQSKEAEKADWFQAERELRDISRLAHALYEKRKQEAQRSGEAPAQDDLADWFKAEKLLFGDRT